VAGLITPDPIYYFWGVTPTVFFSKKPLLFPCFANGFLRKTVVVASICQRFLEENR
jgi:hypothetical protein